MNNQQAYNRWSETYDAVINKTRDLEAKALREMISRFDNADVLEIGCGTGKNTEWLLTKAKHLVATDFSAEMLAKARSKITSEKIEFRQFDLRENWSFSEDSFDLIICSLVLEHIENLDFVFGQARKILREGGLFYVGELHPFKQYQGSKARFETKTGIFELECFTHHVSEFFRAAKSNDFEALNLKEWFDEGEDKNKIPRLLTMIFRMKK